MNRPNPKQSNHRMINTNQQSDSDKEERKQASYSRLPSPIPINAFRMRAVREFPMAESNLLQEGTDFIELTLAILTSQPEKLRDEGHHRWSINATHTFRKRKRQLGSRMEEFAQQHPNKARRTDSGLLLLSDSSTETTSSTSTQIFRPHQTTLWSTRYNELCNFVKTHGHCNVPRDWKDNVPLAQWVKRQRNQLKLKNSGKHSTLTDERQSALNKLGFIWDSHNAVWEERFQELKAFKIRHGHCNVPSTHKENHALAVWVQCQRRQYKLTQDVVGVTGDKRGRMKPDRMARLQELGFEWDPRRRGGSG